MLGKFLSNLENDDNPLLSPTLWGLQKNGMWQPKNVAKPKLVYAIHFALALFLVSQYIELYRIRSDKDLALRNVSTTMLSAVCCIKVATFVAWQKDWNSIFEYVSKLEKRQLSQKDKVTEAIIGGYIKYSRRLTFFYWALVAATITTICVAPLVGFLSSAEYRERIRNGTAPYPESVSAWMPFDRTRGLGYWVTIISHNSIMCYGATIVANYDGNAMVLMTFFAGQLKILKENCSRLFDDEEETTCEDAIKKIRDCHYHHQLLIKHTKVFNGLLSPVMFTYVIICSLMICASAIQITKGGTTTVQRIWISEYVIALIAQLFLYCWHSSEVLARSDEVEDGVYASAWWSRSIRVRRCVLLLAGQLRTSVVFTAGPFTEMTLPTFVAILKASYSYYTLLVNKDD
ncbi:hypothetical protein ABMA28_008170 [Loxostege sticticalis]|uniref:Odorant receptor n=1 Tax=Loxostege sticticalis TaxID=481309 RepID=A0ABD0SK27_LOXSC